MTEILKVLDDALRTKDILYEAMLEKNIKLEEALKEKTMQLEERNKIIDAMTYELAQLRGERKEAV